jgi:hypothetical protein
LHEWPFTTCRFRLYFVHVYLEVIPPRPFLTTLDDDFVANISTALKELPMYVIRRVHDVEPGTARMVASLMQQ